METWKKIDEGYEVSDEGRVRSTAFWYSPRLLTIHYDRDGYAYVDVGPRRARRRYFLARLVLQVFDRPPVEGDEARHLDGCKKNNRRSNLAWGTHEENMADRRRHGTVACGERNGSSKLTEDIVRSIKARLGAGELVKVIAIDHQLHETTVRDIRRGRLWKHVL